MRFLKLGVQTAVIDDEDRVLLSRRGDLNVWNLPGGRVDSGEHLEEAAAREVFEETGLIVHIERAAGLYYLAGWNRLNILFTALPLTGELQQSTRETHENRFFEVDELPDMLWHIMPLDALAETRHKPRIIETSSDELRRVRAQLHWRWVKNLLNGRLEPRFPHFDIEAVGLVWEDRHQRLLTYPHENGRTLPRVICDGNTAPWMQLSDNIKGKTGLEVPFRWVGLRENTELNKLEFVFAMTVEETEPQGDAEWSMIQNAAFTGRDEKYLELVKPTFHRDPVWMLKDSQRNEESKMIVMKKQ